MIVLHAPSDKEVETVDEILAYAAQPAFLMYLTIVTVFSLYMIYKVVPTHGTKNPMVYLSVCSLVGSVSVMAIKVCLIFLPVFVERRNSSVISVWDGADVGRDSV